MDDGSHQWAWWGTEGVSRLLATRWETCAHPATPIDKRGSRRERKRKRSSPGLHPDPQPLTLMQYCVALRDLEALLSQIQIIIDQILSERRVRAPRKLCLAPPLCNHQCFTLHCVPCISPDIMCQCRHARSMCSGLSLPLVLGMSAASDLVLKGCQ